MLNRQAAKPYKGRLTIKHKYNGAGNGDRTRDPQLGRLMLCQLSYSRINRKKRHDLRIKTWHLTRSRTRANRGSAYFYCTDSSSMRQQATSIRGQLMADLVERGGFEPPKDFANRFTVCPLWPLGNLSGFIPRINDFPMG